MSDCGTAFDSELVKDLCLKNGIIQVFSCPYTPETHGKIERLWRTISEMARGMLFESGLPQQKRRFSKYRIQEMINEGLINFNKSDTDDFYTKHLCRLRLSNNLRRPPYNLAIPKATRAESR